MKAFRPALVAPVLGVALLACALLAEEEPASRWAPSKGLAGGRRVALLVGVGKYARHPAWDLPWVASDLETLERSLLANAGFHEVSKLEDEEVSKAALETRLEKLAASLSGEGNLLLVFWSGHGCVDATGEPRYLLSDSDDAPGGEFRNTLGESDLAELFAPLRRSGKARVVLVADACRVPVMAPARSAPRFVTAADAALYSTRRGEFASVEPGAKRSAFVESLDRALSKLSAKPSLSLGELADWIRADMAERGLKQTPELAAAEGAAALPLYDRANLSFGVRVLHALSREEIRGALVKIPALGKAGDSPAAFRGLAPGAYRLEVSREGFFRELVEVELGERDSGGTLEVSLSPEYVELEGSVSDEAQKPLAGIRCTLAGSYGDFLRGYHTWEATSDARGRFVFRIPPRAAVRAVLASAGPKGKRELPLDLAKLSPRESVVRGRILRSYAVGRIVVPTDEVVRVEELGLRGRDAARWKAAEEVLEKALAGSASRDDLDIAIACYGNLAPLVEEGARAKVRGRLRLARAELVGHLVASGNYEEARRAAEEALGEFPGDAAFEEAKETCLREAIPGELRERIAGANRAVDAGDFRGAEEAYRGILERAADLTPFYKAAVEDNLAAVVEKLATDAVVGLPAAYLAGDYERAAACLEDLRRLAPEEPLIPIMERKLAPHVDTEPPSVKIVSLMGPLGAEEVHGPRVETPEARIAVAIEASDARGIRAIRRNGEEAKISPGEKTARVEILLPLEEDETPLRIEAEDLSGKTARREVVFVRVRDPSPLEAPEGFSFAGRNAQGLAEYRHEMTGILFVRIPGGKSSMGSPRDEPGRRPDEGPAHEVELGPFLLAKHEVTQAQWELVMGKNPSYFRGSDLPVEQVSWEDCQEFCKKTGLSLPTEAQWEYACRAGEEGPYPEGGELDDFAWYEKDAGRRTHPAGEKRPNAFGLHDMRGNVWEWCEDVYDPDFYEKPEARAKDPVSTGGSTGRVARGGSCRSPAPACRPACRERRGPKNRDFDLGFRPRK